MSKTLLGYQRAWLRKAAHSLDPIVTIGKAGLSDSVEQAISDAFKHHELIKIRFQDLKEEREDASAHIAEHSGATLVSLVGNVAIFYKAAQDPKARKILVPVRKTAKSQAKPAAKAAPKIKPADD